MQIFFLLACVIILSNTNDDDVEDNILTIFRIFDLNYFVDFASKGSDRFFLSQICTEIVKSLRKEDFGSCETQLEEFVKKSNSRFPYAAAFKPPSEAVLPSESNHVSHEQDSYNSN